VASDLDSLARFDTREKLGEIVLALPTCGRMTSSERCQAAATHPPNLRFDNDEARSEMTPSGSAMAMCAPSRRARGLHAV
jgi:hypothetical protein